MTDRIEFTFNARRFAVSYPRNAQRLEEHISDRIGRNYWRVVSPYGRTRNLRLEVLGKRSRKDFRALAEATP